MKRTAHVLLILTAVMCTLLTGKESSAMSFDDAIYKFKSAIFKIRTTGPMSKGVEEIYIDSEGRKEATYSEMTISAPFGIKQTQKQIIFRDGNALYVYDEKEKTATKRDLKKDAETMLKGAKSKDINTLSKDMVKEMGGRKDRTEKLTLEDGQSIMTEVYVFDQFGTEVWYYKGYPVKSVTNMRQMSVTREVVEMQINVKIPKDKITFPEGTKITKAPEIEDVFNQINAYKDSPEFQEAQGKMKEVDWTGEDKEEGEKAIDGKTGEDVKKALTGVLKSFF